MFIEQPLDVSSVLAVDNLTTVYLVQKPTEITGWIAGLIADVILHPESMCQRVNLRHLFPLGLPRDPECDSDGLLPGAAFMDQI